VKHIHVYVLHFVPPKLNDAVHVTFTTSCFNQDKKKKKKILNISKTRIL